MGTGSIDNGTGHETHAFLLTPVAPITITTTDVPYALYSESYSKRIAASGGVPAYTWTITAGTLPAGLTLNSSTGTISGSISGPITILGDYPFTIQVRDTVGLTATKDFTLTVTGNVFLTDVTLPNPVVGTPYNRQLGSTGGLKPYTFALVGGALPAGLQVSSTGFVVGTATVPGNFNFSVQITDANNITSPIRSYPLTVVIGPLTIITPSPLSSATRNVSYNKLLATTGGLPPFTWSVTTGSLPVGLTLNPTTGLISGKTNVAANIYNFTVQVSDSQSTPATASKAFSIQVK